MALTSLRRMLDLARRDAERDGVFDVSFLKER